MKTRLKHREMLYQGLLVECIKFATRILCIHYFGSYENLVGRVENAGSFRISDVSERISVIEAKNSTALVFPLNSHKNPFLAEKRDVLTRKSVVSRDKPQ